MFFIKKGPENRIVFLRSEEDEEVIIEAKNREASSLIYSIAKDNKWPRFSIESNGVEDDLMIQIIEDVKRRNWSYTDFKNKDFYINFINSPVQIDEKSLNAELWAKKLIVTPSNICTPEFLANNIKNNFIDEDISVTILNQNDIKEAGLNLIIAVSSGSTKEPKMVVIKKGENPSLALVGKGVCFDSGGISLKPSKDMHEMKGDMSGAIVCAAAIKLLENTPHSCYAILPLVENSVAKNPAMPGDIYKCFSGKSAEILNTDAEGRLILSDAVAYANKLMENIPEENRTVITVATLTGAASIALGDVYAAIMGHSETVGKVIKASKEVGEKLWELPFDDETFLKSITSEIADFKNIGDGKAGTITGGKFIEKCSDTRGKFAHIDIAATVKIDSLKINYIRTLVNFVKSEV